MEFLGPEVARTDAASGGSGPLRERVWHELEVSDEDILVEKSAASAFLLGRSPLPAALETRGIDTVLITGTATNATLYTVHRSFGHVPPTIDMIG